MENRVRKRNKRTRSCGYRMRVVLKLYEKRWVMDVREPLYNHRASDGSLVHPIIRRRARKANVRSVIKDAWEDEKSIKETVALLRRMWPRMPLIHRDVVDLGIRLYGEAKLPPPRVIVTDADGALKAAILQAFPTSKHFLCVWHVNKNIQAWCKKLWKRKQIPASTVEEHQANADEIDRRWSDVLQD
jgi:hypothetical protein